jgi:hypothetical protein
MIRLTRINKDGYAERRKEVYRMCRKKNSKKNEEVSGGKKVSKICEGI